MAGAPGQHGAGLVVAVVAMSGVQPSPVAVLQPSSPLLSPNWFRVARLRPRLDASVRVDRAVVRGEVWHTLARADGARSFRLNPAAWQIVGRWDGQHSLQQLWDAALREQPDAAPAQDEVLEWLTRLQIAGLVSLDGQPDFGERGDGRAAPPRLDAAERGETPQSWLAWRIPLGRPDAALARAAHRLAPVLRSRLLLPLMLLVVGHAGWQAVAQAGPLAAALGELAGSPRGWWLALLLYPVVKLLHELGHGVVSRLHGAPVPQWGVTLLMLMPVPYVDASAASALPRAGQRLAVASAGIVVELLLASAGLAVALAVEPGMLRDIGLTVFFIGALSTLAVNGNPLLRFDGYHMLCDAAGLPNLATRSQRWWHQRLAQGLLRVEPLHPLQPAPGERRWLVGYAPLSLAVRWLVALAVVGWLLGVSVWLALAVALGLAWTMLLQPLRRALRFLGQTGLPAARQRRRLGGLAAVAAGVLVLVAVVPVPHRTLVQGIWWPPEDALLRTQVDGFVSAVHVQQGQTVQPGEPLLTLHLPSLDADLARLAAREQALTSEHWQAVQDDPPRAVQIEQELLALRAEQARARAQGVERVVVARVAGQVAWPQASDLPGRWLPRGTLVGHLVTDQPARVQVAIPHDRLADIARAAPDVEVRRALAGAPPLSARWDGRWSGGGAALPSPALAERHGGAIPTDPQDHGDLKPLQAVALADVWLPTAGGADGRPGTERIGERVWVRFDHGSLPLAQQAWQSLRQLLLRQLAGRS
jgi:putative peptide zinc metalloprotease protein